MFNYINTDYTKTRKNREPVMTLKELAKETGKNYSTLRRRLEKSDPQLDVKMQAKGCKYYSRAELLKWVGTIET